jgi:phage shock protein C
MGQEFAPPPPPPRSPDPASSAPYPPYRPEPPRPRRLMRSRRERMWAGVAGGMAEYFDLDPNLVRLLWVVATVLSHGAGVAVYILFWVILPRDDRAPDVEGHNWRDWSDEFHSETQRLAEEARRMADDMRGVGHTWRAPNPDEPGPGETPRDPATAKGTPGAYVGSPPAEPAWWADPARDVERHRSYGGHPRSTGIVLVTLGVVLLAANAGIFSWIDWPTMWPVIFIGLGVILLARRSGWGR